MNEIITKRTHEKIKRMIAEELGLCAEEINVRTRSRGYIWCPLCARDHFSRSFRVFHRGVKVATVDVHKCVEGWIIHVVDSRSPEGSARQVNPQNIAGPGRIMEVAEMAIMVEIALKDLQQHGEGDWDIKNWTSWWGGSDVPERLLFVIDVNESGVLQITANDYNLNTIYEASGEEALATLRDILRALVAR